MGCRGEARRAEALLGAGKNGMTWQKSDVTPPLVPVGKQQLTLPQALRVAIRLQEEGELPEAEKIYRQILERDPDHADSYHRLGMIANQIGLNEVAVHLSERALVLDPLLVEAHNNLGNALQELGQQEAAIACYRRALTLCPEFEKAHCNLGNALQRQGRAAEAIASYRQALALRGDYAEAHNNLAFLYMGMGREAEALREFRLAVAAKPDLAAATHMIAVLTGQTTAGAPAAYVKGLFDQYAVNFERHLVEELRYTVPQLALARCEELGLAAGGRFRRTLDLGCGTGLGGALFRELSEELIGVDLSEKMLFLAREKQVYDRLAVAEMGQFLQTASEGYDLFLAFDSFIYLGELEPILRAITARSLAGGYVVFTTESLAGDGYHLQPSSRYAHGRGYVERLAAQCGWRLVLCAAVDLRKDKWGWIAGDLYIFRIGAASSPGK